MKLSIIITAHDEGLLAHKTMLSIFRALKLISDSYEIIIHIDNGTKETEKYFAKFKNDKRFRIFRNNFGDLGRSRNFAIKKAKGEFLSLIDGDDLVSENYFAAMLKTLGDSKQEIVVHPNYCLTFEDMGRHYAFQTLGESFNSDLDAILLFGKHRWISAMSARRSTLLKYPYMYTRDGFGHEDYALNITLTEQGIQHRIAPETIYFYRRKEFSLLKQSSSQHLTQPYSELFSIKKWQKMDYFDRQVGPVEDTKSKLRTYYIKLRNNRFCNFFITPAAEITKKITGKKIIQEPEIPASVMTEWKKIAQIEAQMFPVPEILSEVSFYDTETPGAIGGVYHQLCLQTKHQPNYIFMVPWVVSGGADKVLLNYLQALQELYPKWKIAVITTMPSDNHWHNRLPDNAFLLDYGNLAANLSFDDREILLTRLLIQLQCPKIHIINSADTVLWIKDHPQLIKANFDISVSLFCHGIISGTNCEGLWDLADPYLSRIYPLIDKIYTDNTKVIDRAVKLHGFDRKKFSVHYQPAPSCSQGRHHTVTPPLRILWANRIAAQKNPQLLVRIAEKLDPQVAQIDAYGRIDEVEQDGFEFPENSPVLKYCGPFDNFDDLQPDQYDLFLHTSRIDGMPNVVLEAAAAGLVPIAGDVGGISDFVKNRKTGFLITDADNEDDYIKVIQKIYENPDILSKLIDGGHKLLQEQYSWTNFLKRVKKDF